MCLFLVLFWCSAVVERRGGPNIFADNSLFGDFNSRLGGANSRFAVLREFAGKRLICFTVFAAKRQLFGENRENSRFRRDKLGILLRRQNARCCSLRTMVSIRVARQTFGSAATLAKRRARL
jgi:hypothetical protein